MSDARAGVPPLLRALVDDAGLFPPERLPMPDATARHRKDEAAAHPMLTRRFLCPASRLTELREQLTDADRFRVGLIADTGAEGVRPALEDADTDPRLVTELVEVPLGTGDQAAQVATAIDELADLSPGTAVYLEPNRAPGWLDAVTAVAKHPAGARSGGPRRGLKVRCGGVRAELFPSAAELAAFVRACADAGVPFKATAGLHHAVRYRDPATGFDHHGFLNLLVAAGLAVQDAGEAEMRAALGSADGAELAARARVLDGDTVRRTRELLVSYGSCSTSEPIEAVAELGLATAEER